MSAWRKIAFACIVCSPAILVVGNLATAIETQSGAAIGPPSAPKALQLAEDATTAAPAAAYDPVAASAYTVTDSDMQKVEPEIAQDAKDNPPVFTEEYMHDQKNIDAGKEVWDGTCTGCHGARAYPGKAPKLRPSKYTPGFIFHQATFGGKKMPPFGDVFTREERMAVASWVLSEHFAP